MGKIILAGELHDDPCLAEHAGSVLQVEKPDAITLESNAAERIAFAFVRSKVSELLSQCGIASERIPGYMRDYFRIVQRTFAVADVSREYALTHRIPLEYVGHPDQKDLLRLIEIYDRRPIPLDSLLDPVISTNANGSVVAQKYKECRTKIAAGSYSGVSQFGRQKVRTPKGEIRDDYSAERLRELIKRGHQKICHFCGIGHILDDERRETIYAILKDEFDIGRITIDQHSRG